MNVAIVDDNESQLYLYADAFFGFMYNFYFHNDPIKFLQTPETDLKRMDVIIVDHSLDGITIEKFLDTISKKTDAKIAIVASFEQDIFREQYLKDSRISNLFCKFNKNGYNFDDITKWLQKQNIFKKTLHNISLLGNLR